MTFAFNLLLTVLLILGAWKAVEIWPVLAYWWPRREGVPLVRLLEMVSPRSLDLDDLSRRAAISAAYARRAKKREELR